jgi:hypothetical protein
MIHPIVAFLLLQYLLSAPIGCQQEKKGLLSSVALRTSLLDESLFNSQG